MMNKIVSFDKEFTKLEYFLLFWALAISVRSCTLTSTLDFRINPVGFLLTVIPCILVIRKRNIRFSNEILTMFAVLTVWVGVHYFIDRNFLIFSYFLIYVRILVAYTLVNTFKDKLFKCFHNIVVLLTFIDLVLWVISMVIGANTLEAIAPFVNSFSNDTGSFLIFTVPNVRIYEGQGLFGLVRNSGFCWEPGIFSCTLVLAIFCNIMVNGVKLRKNKSLIVLLFGLFSSFSTTGYCSLIVLIAGYYLFSNKTKFAGAKILSAVILIPVILYVADLPFMRAKILEQLDKDNFLTESARMDYVEGMDGIATLTRFEGMTIDVLNIQDKPLLGYGTFSESFSYNNISENINTSNGLTNFIACYGGILTILILFLLIQNSIKLRSLFPDCNNSFLLVLLAISISYSFVPFPIFMALSLYYFFKNDKSPSDYENISNRC